MELFGALAWTVGDGGEIGIVARAAVDAIPASSAVIPLAQAGAGAFVSF